MARTTNINVRLAEHERQRLERLAAGAGLSTSDTVRALLHGATKITPAKPATAVFTNDNGAGHTRQDAPRAVVA